MNNTEAWATDVAVSQPEPNDPSQPVIISLDGGFAMTTGGITHDIPEAEAEDIFMPWFGPQGYKP